MKDDSPVTDPLPCTDPTCDDPLTCGHSANEHDSTTEHPPQVNGDITNDLDPLTTPNNNKHVTRKSSKESMRKHSASKSDTAMQACIDGFKSFYHMYVTNNLFKDTSISEKCFQNMCRTANPYPSFTDGDSVLDTDSIYSSDLDSPLESDRRPTEGDTVVKVTEQDVIYTFKCACSLLLDFSGFPIYCTDYYKVLQKSFSTGNLDI